MRPQNRLLVMSGAHLLNDGLANYLPAVLPVILVALGAPKDQAGVLMGVLIIGQGLQPVIGWFSDKVGGKAIVLAGLYGTTLCGALLGLVGYYWIMVPLLVALGILNSCFHPQAMGGVRYLAAQRRGLSTSVFLIGGQLGAGIWPALAGLVVVHLGLGYLWLLALPAIAAFPLLLPAFPSLPSKPRTTPPIAWRNRWKPLAPVVVFSTLQMLVFFLLITYLPQRWNQLGGGVVGGGALITTLYLVGIPGNILGGHLVDRLSFRAVGVLTGAATMVGMLALMLASGWAYWLVLAFLGMSIFSIHPTSVVLAQEVLSENPSMGAGISEGFCHALAAIALMALSHLVNVIDFQGMLWLAMGISVPAAAAGLLLPRDRRHQATGTTNVGVLEVRAVSSAAGKAI